MLVFSMLCAPIKNNQIPIITAATVIIIVITISFFLMNLDNVDLPSLSEYDNLLTSLRTEYVEELNLKKTLLVMITC